MNELIAKEAADKIIELLELKPSQSQRRLIELAIGNAIALGQLETIKNMKP